MDFNEYKFRIAEAKKEHDKMKYSIAKEFAESNSNVRIGDLVIDTSGNRFIIDNMSVRLNFNGLPVMHCSGFLMTKKMKPRIDSQRITREDSELKSIAK